MSNALYQFTMRGDNLPDLTNYAPRMLQELRNISVIADVSSDQQDNGRTAAIGDHVAIVHVLHIGRFDERVIEILIGWVDWIIDPERTARLRQVSGHDHVADKLAGISCLVILHGVQCVGRITVTGRSPSECVNAVASLSASRSGSTARSPKAWTTAGRGPAGPIAAVSTQAFPRDIRSGGGGAAARIQTGAPDGASSTGVAAIGSHAGASLVSATG